MLLTSKFKKLTQIETFLAVSSMALLLQKTVLATIRVILYKEHF